MNRPSAGTESPQTPPPWVGRAHEALGENRFAILDIVFGLSDPSRVTYAKYRSNVLGSCTEHYPEAPEHLVQLADCARAVADVKTTLTALEPVLKLSKRGLENPEKVARSIAGHHARLMFELTWDRPFASGEPGNMDQTAEKLRQMHLLAALTSNAVVRSSQLVLISDLAKPGCGRLARLHTPTVRSEAVAARSMLTYYDSTRGRRRGPFLGAAVLMLNGALDFLAAYRLPAATPTTRPTHTPAPLPPRARSTPGFPSLLSGSFTRDRELSDAWDGSGEYCIGDGCLVETDAERLTVIEGVERALGERNCYRAQGVFDSSGGIDLTGSRIDDTYVVLVVRRQTDVGDVEDAIAISAIRGLNATFYVRGDISPAHWTTVLSGSKQEALDRGARRLIFKSTLEFDEYETMTEKLLTLFNCTADAFINRAFRNVDGIYELV